MCWNLFLSNLFVRWNRPDINNMKRRKDELTSVEAVQFLITQHKDIRTLIKTQKEKKTGKAVTTNDEKTVYMFSNIFVLYYIQLSLLKWNTDDYYIAGQRKQRLTVQPVPCHLQDCDMMCRCSVCRGLRKTVDWCCLMGFCPLSYSSFLPALEQGFLSKTQTATAPPPHVV